MTRINPITTTSIPTFKGIREAGYLDIAMSNSDTIKDYEDSYNNVLKDDFVEKPSLINLVRNLGLFDKDVVKNSRKVRKEIDKIGSSNKKHLNFLA